jgi:uncharacterized protein
MAKYKPADEATIKEAVRNARREARASVLNRLRREAGLLGAAALLAGGMALAGLALGSGIKHSHRGERSVTVRGLAERDVTADLAVWTLSFAANADNLAAAQAKVERDAGLIRAFFTRQGFPADAVQVSGVQVARETEDKHVRFVVRERITLRSTDVHRVEDAVHHQFDLVRRGVFLEEGSKANFLYTQLNKVKPEMVAQATRDARASAEQFARDSESELGGIRTANQGYFEVTARAGDASEGWGAAETPFKKLRVVTTVTYLLR